MKKRISKTRRRIPQHLGSRRTAAAGADLLTASLEAMGQARELADQIGFYVYGTAW